MRSFTRIFTVLFLVLAVIGCNEQDDTLNPAAADNASMQKKPTTTTNGPVINSVNKSSAIIGDEIVITGENFGPRYKYATNYVRICGVKARVYSLWSKTEIHVTVPSGSVDPDDELAVTVNDVASAGVQFEILWPGEVIIGDQTWSGTNLDVDQFNDATQTTIPQISSQAEYEAWVDAGANTPAWCWYNFDENMGKRYGKLYNWYAVMDSRGLAPSGWKIPSDEDWSDLADYLGASSAYNAIGYFGTNEGGKLKEVGSSSWSVPNEGATNSSGFTALPGGYLSYLGNFVGFVFYDNTPFGLYAAYWSSTVHETDPTQAWCRVLYKDEARLYRNYGKHGNFFSVRLIKDN
jgi:uncharacterized protein (TIGR02145 family)